MKPRMLKIRGLNSFIEEQKIDFSKLAEYGLFGIFGPTGSGKSTILDAITLVLYGTIPRCGKRASGFINTNTDEAYVYYEFEIGPRTRRKKYYVERLIEKLDEGSIRTKKAIICDTTNPDKVEVLSDRVAETNRLLEGIIGLSSDDFTRSVVLPQGSFSEFLRLTGMERREMLERIFKLEEYGKKLMDKARRFKRIKETERSELNGKLSAYEGVSQEAYEDAVNEADEWAVRQKTATRRYEEAEKDFERYKSIWELRQEKEREQRKQEALMAQKESIHQKEQALEWGKRAFLIAPLIEKVDEKEAALKAKLEETEQIGEDYNRICERAEDIENHWRKALEKKERDLPQLSAKREILLQAVKMQDQIRTDIEKIEEMKKAYNLTLQQIEERKKAADFLLLELENGKGQLKDLEAQMRELRISPNYRQELDTALEHERSYVESLQECKTLYEKGEAQRQKTQILREELDNTQHVMEEKEDVWKDLQAQWKELQENCPGNRNDLLEQQKALGNMQSEIRELRDICKDMEELKKEHRELSHSREEIIGHLDKARQAYQEWEDRFRNLDHAYQQMQRMNMASILSKELQDGTPCPVCGSTHHPHPRIGGEELLMEEMKQLAQQRDAANEELIERKGTLASLQAKLDGIAAQLHQNEKALEEKKQRRMGRDVHDLEKRWEDLNRSFTETAEKIDIWESRQEQLRKAIDGLNEELSELKAQKASKGAALSAETNLLLSLEMEYKKALQNMEENKKAYEEVKRKLGLNNIAAKIQEIREQDHKLEEMRKWEEEVQALLDRWTKDLEENRRKMADLEIQKTKEEEGWKEKQRVVDERRKELHRLTEGKEASSYLEEISGQIEKIQAEWNELESSLRQINEEKEKLYQAYLTAAENSRMLKEDLEKEIRELERMIEEKGFRTKEEVLEKYLSQNEMDRLDVEINSYKDELKIVHDRIAAIEEKLKGQRVSEADWMEIQQRRKGLREELETIKEQTIRLASKKEELQRRLKEKQELEADYKALDHECGLLNDLMSLLQGKKFVDYIAQRQLRIIAHEASRRLKEITRGRYALELDSGGNFIMRDDFNGGARRPTHTLSGGETFVTSLSLALALSAHIQLGKAVLEFFFLDEGFGTLDEELLNVVISSLEQLRSEQLSVGLISHVEELRHRIPRKLLVHPAVPGLRGTRVEME
ncbi:MAG: AAA family ATPase [Clostridia bacterium]|jgi:exonuclease SbcC